MSHTTIQPKLRLHKTISHPIEEVRVLGFEGRDQHLGRDVLALKSHELPVVRDGPAVTHYVIPAAQTDVAIRDAHLYVLGENYVYYFTPVVVEDAPVHTGTKYGQQLTGAKVAIEDAQQWPRHAVEVN